MTLRERLEAAEAALAVICADENLRQALIAHGGRFEDVASSMGYFLNENVLRQIDEACRAERAVAFEEAALYWGLHKISESTEEQFAADLRALSRLPATLTVVEKCHICGSVDAVVGVNAALCSKGHPTVVSREALEKVKEALTGVVIPASASDAAPLMAAYYRKVRAALALLEKEGTR